MKKDLRCTCKKLVCQVEGDDLIIKCRHCKKLIYIHTRGIISMEYRIEEPPVQFQTVSSTRTPYESRKVN